MSGHRETQLPKSDSCHFGTRATQQQRLYSITSSVRAMRRWNLKVLKPKHHKLQRFDDDVKDQRKKRGPQDCHQAVNGYV
jgi:hypothetical protein